MAARPRDTFFEGPGVTARQIMEARGYLAEDFYVRSRDGYTLRITRGRNPLLSAGPLPGRAPILFVHGAMQAANAWLANSFGARPSDLSEGGHQLTGAARGPQREQLDRKLAKLPAARSLPLLAMDFGHEVFLLSRRGTPGSQTSTPHETGAAHDGPHRGLAPADNRRSEPANRINARGPVTALWRELTSAGGARRLAQQARLSLDRKFWNFSLDEQAAYDFPRAVEFVCELTKRPQLAVVGHSVGAAIPLMALSARADLNEKISALVLWSHAFTAGLLDRNTLLSFLEPALKYYVGPVPLLGLTEPMQALAGLFCKSRLAQTLLCRPMGDLVQGTGAQPLRPEFINTNLFASSSHELGQLMQGALLGGQLHHYSLRLRDAEPYNLSRITNTRMSFYLAGRDSVLTASKAALKLLRVPHRVHDLALFNHQSFFYDPDNARQVNIPSLRDIQELSEGSAQ